MPEAYFHGYRDRERLRVELVNVDGVAAPIVHYGRHSQTGFECGYSGSGPSDLALSLEIAAAQLLAAETGERQLLERAAPRCYQELKVLLVAKLPRDVEWFVPVLPIFDWLQFNAEHERGDVIAFRAAFQTIADGCRERPQ